MPMATATATATAMTGTGAHVKPATQETIVKLILRVAAATIAIIMCATTNVPTPALMATTSTIVMTSIRVVTTAPATVVVEFHIAMSAFAQLLDVDKVSCAKSESSWPQSTP